MSNRLWTWNFKEPFNILLSLVTAPASWVSALPIWFCHANTFIVIGQLSLPPSPPSKSPPPHSASYQCSTVPLPGSTGTRGAAQLWTLLPAPSQPPPPAAPDRPPLQHADNPTWGSGAPLALTGHGTLEQPTALLRNVLTSHQMVGNQAPSCMPCHYHMSAKSSTQAQTTPPWQYNLYIVCV